MAIAFVQQTTFVNPNTGFNTAAQTAGNVNFIEVMVAGTTTAPTGPSGGTPGDTVNGNYTLVSSTGGTTVKIYLYAFFNIASASAGTNQLSVIAPSGSTRMVSVGHEYSGVANTLDGSVVTNSGSGTAASSAITTTNAADLLMSIVGEQLNGTITGGSGYTTLWTDTASPPSTGAQYQITTATGTYNGNFTVPNGTVWIALQAAYKAAATTLNQSVSGNISVTGVVSPSYVGGITFIQQSVFVSPNVQFGSAQTAGNTNFIQVVIAGSATAPTGPGNLGTPGDTLNGDYTLIASSGGSTIKVWLYAFFNIVSGAANSNIITVHAPSGATRMDYVAQEFAGLANVLDGSASINTGNGTAASAALTTTNATDLLLSVVGETSAGAVTGGAGYITLWTQTASAPSDGAQYKITGATGTYNGNFTVVNGTAWSALQVAYESASVPVSPSVNGTVSFTGVATPVLILGSGSGNINVTAAIPIVNIDFSPAFSSNILSVSGVVIPAFSPLFVSQSGNVNVSGLIAPIISPVLVSLSGTVSVTGLVSQSWAPIVSGIVGVSGSVVPGFSPTFITVSGSIAVSGTVNPSWGVVLSGSVNTTGGINNLLLGISPTSGSFIETGTVVVGLDAGLGVSNPGLVSVTGNAFPSLPSANVSVSGTISLTGATNLSLSFTNTGMVVAIFGAVSPLGSNVLVNVSGTVAIVGTVTPLLILPSSTGSFNIVGGIVAGITQTPFSGSILVSGSLIPVITPIFVALSGTIGVTGGLPSSGKGINMSLIGSYDFWGGGFC